MESLAEFMDFIILGITIIVMAVPEGLPMAVVISLAYSVEKMRQLNNLVRKMDACETMGNVTDICSDKTGTLTENNMTVIDVFYGNNLLSFASKSFTDKLKQDQDLRDLCVSAAVNSTATPVFTRSLKEQMGNKTEMALMEFCYNLGVDYSKVRTLDDIVLMVPFSSERKKMLTLFKDEKGTMWLYAKGAPEIILEACSLYRADNKTFRLEKDYRHNLEKNTLTLIASKKARAIASAKVEVTSYKEGDDLEKFFKDMVFLGVFGIMDPIRLDVPPAVATAQGAGVTVRMVTGDNTQIGAAIGKECGIVNKEWTPEVDPDVVLDGAAFREKVGGLKWKEEQDGDKVVRTPYVGDMHAFNKLEPKLRVIGRCKPDDKLLLVTGLQALGKVVAVTGDGANDAPALNRADVGLGMGKTGTDICKDASKIVLLDDNFASIITAIKFVATPTHPGKKHLRCHQEVHEVPADCEPDCYGGRHHLRLHHQGVTHQRYPDAVDQCHHGQLLGPGTGDRATHRRAATATTHQEERAHRDPDPLECGLLPVGLPVCVADVRPVLESWLVRHPIQHRHESRPRSPRPTRPSKLCTLPSSSTCLCSCRHSTSSTPGF